MVVAVRAATLAPVVVGGQITRYALQRLVRVVVGVGLIMRATVVVEVLGYWVRASRIGEGATRQAALLLRDFGFGTVGLNRLEIVVADGNGFSRKVAESVGAVYEGLQRLRLKVGDVAHDAHMYAFLNPAAKRATPSMLAGS